MSATLEAKALVACRESAAAANEIKRLRTVIADSLHLCFVAFQDANPDEFPVLEWKSHLEDAYAFEEEYETDYSDGGRIYLTDMEQRFVLAECKYCLAAHNAIQDRKKAEKKLAAARRRITIIGRQA